MTAPDATRSLDVEITGPFGIRGSLNQAEARIVAVEGLTVAHVELVATSKRGAALLDDAMTLTPDGLEIRLPTLSEAIAAQGLWRGLASGASWGLRVEARVPAGSWLDLRSKVASLTTEGRFGSVRWASRLGDVKLERTEFLSADIGMGNLKVGYCDAAEITGGAGDVTFGEIGGSVTVDGGAGDVRVRMLRGTARIRTGLGDVTLDEVHANGGAVDGDGDRRAADVRVTCTAGDIKLKELVAGSVGLSTTMGDVTVGVARGSDLVAADIHSRSGSARCKVPLAPGAPGAPGAQPSGPFDAPLAWGTPSSGVHVHAESKAGDITVRHSRRGKRDRRSEG